MVLGIIAPGISSGGGLTHLIELLKHAQPEKYNFNKVVLWSSYKTIEKLPEKPWLHTKTHPLLNKSVAHRFIWMKYYSKAAAKNEQCNLVFAPGGSYIGSFRPFVTMSRNLLPFENKEIMRFGVSLNVLRYFSLRLTQTYTFNKANGVIFLTEYAKRSVLKCTNSIMHSAIIPHGINPLLKHKPRKQLGVEYYTKNNPIRVLYVSIINHYKHQWHLVNAVKILIDEGYPINLDLVGPANKKALKKLKKAISLYDPQKKWVKYHGAVPHNKMGAYYKEAEIGVFASSCETFGQILTEKMAAGLPMACSNKSAMPEILKDAGIYFDPEKPLEIASVLRKLILSPDLRYQLALKGHKLAQQYSWDRSANETFSFLQKTISD